jgi:hypothetical protein
MPDTPPYDAAQHFDPSAARHFGRMLFIAQGFGVAAVSWLASILIRQPA